jgi:hypothetical protein
MKTKTKTDAPLLELTANPVQTADAAVKGALQTAKPAPKAKRQEIATRIEPPQKQDEPADFLSTIVRAARDKSVDVAKMRELLDMKRELENDEKARLFNIALHAAQGEMPKIVKDRENPDSHSRYATLEKISSIVDPIARKHGLTTSYGTADSPLPNHYRIVCYLSHTAGHVREYHVDLPADTTGQKGAKNKTDLHGAGSAMSYGRRYIKVLMYDLVIANEDRDGNRDTGGNVTAAQVGALAGRIKAVGLGEDAFLDFFQIEKLDDLPESKFDLAMTKLDAFAKNKAATK